MSRESNSNFKSHYEDWRKTRINKVLQNFETSFFQNKTILEVGCGYGDIGKFFTELGSNVIFTEGRSEHIPVIQENNPNSLVLNINHENIWKIDIDGDKNKKFDMIIHFGLLYHLDKWEQDLQCALNQTDLIILETEVADSNEIIEFKLTDPLGYDQAVGESRICTRPSASYIESVFERNNFSYKRYDDEDLNSSFHNYTWKVEETDRGKNREWYGFRRFWIAKRKK